MKRIRKIKIGSMMVPVQYVDDLPDDNAEFCTDPYPRIRICKKLHDDAVASYILHEALHAIIHMYGIDLGRKEEALVRTLQMVLPDLLKRNPDLLRGILD